MSGPGGPAALPVIDVGPLVGRASGAARTAARAAVAAQIQAACRERGFFCVIGEPPAHNGGLILGAGCLWLMPYHAGHA